MAAQPSSPRPNPFLPIQIMASYESDFTEAQIMAANLSHLTQDQIISLTTTAAAHDAAVEASKAAIKAAEDVAKARILADNAKKTSDERQREYEKARNNRTNRRLLLLKKPAKLAEEEANAAKDAADRANEVMNNAARAALEAIAKAEKAECENAKIVLYSDLSLEAARTVRMFGSGMIQDRTLSGDNFHTDVYVNCYSLLHKFILMLNETPYLDLLVSPKKEEVLQLGNSLKVFGFNGAWLRDVRKAIKDDSNLLFYVNEVRRVKDGLYKDIYDNEGLDIYVNGILSTLLSRLPTYYKVDRPNLPVNTNPPNSQANPPDT